MSYSRQIRSILAVLSIFAFTSGLSGCSKLFGSREATPEAKHAVQQVANAYLNNIVHANRYKLEEAILWPAYIVSKGGALKKSDIFEQVAKVRAMHPSAHPLRNLEVKDLDIDGNKAEIRLQREGQPDFTINLEWIGRGWLVTGDTLLGPDGVLERLS